jgi:hypothetical protein
MHITMLKKNSILYQKIVGKYMVGSLSARVDVA